MADKFLQDISTRLNQLSKSEKKVAEVVLHNPAAAIHSSIASLAADAGVSDPTVNRFCRRLGCKGFPDFKLMLAQSIAKGIPYLTPDVAPDDNTGTFVSKIINSTINALKEIDQNIQTELLETIIDHLATAKKIEFYGLGASGPVALDALHKFFRFGTPVTAYTDILMQRMSAAVMEPGDALVIISNTGRTRPLVETAAIASATGATVIGLTAPGTPLAEQCRLVLNQQTSEDTDIYTPMTSRIAHLTLIDILATGVALKRGPGFESHLKKIKDSIGATRYSI